MFTWIAQFLRRAVLGGGLICAAIFSGGCADMVTYANKYHDQGMQLYGDRLYTEAAGAFQKSIRQDPRHYRSQFYLGACYEELGQHQQAFAQYKMALDVMASTPEGKRDQAFRELVLSRYAAAVARHDKAEVELAALVQRAQPSQRVEDWFLLAKVHRLRGDADLAIEAYRRAAQCDNNDFGVRKEFGLYLLDPLNQRREAEYYLRQAYRLNSQDEAVNAALARLAGAPASEGSAGGRAAGPGTVQVPRD